MSKFGWQYKGTRRQIKIGDVVQVSAKVGKEHGGLIGKVVGLQGFITVELLNGVKIDLDARQVKPFMGDNCEKG